MAQILSDKAEAEELQFQEVLEDLHGVVLVGRPVPVVL
jgi:hypothetical protein